MYGMIPIANTENCCKAPPANVLNIPNNPDASCCLRTSASTPGIGKYEPIRNRNIPNKVNKILLRVSLTLNKFSDALNIYYSTSQTPPAASIASFAEDENL